MLFKKNIASILYFPERILGERNEWFHFKSDLLFPWSPIVLNLILINVLLFFIDQEWSDTVFPFIMPC